MNTITTETGVYTPSKTDVVHHTSASLTDRWQPLPVHLLQYDQTLPIIAVDLYANGSQYEVPSGAAVNIRMDKPDGTHAYNPAKGLSYDRHTAYFEVTAQMTAAHGESSPSVEIVVNDGISGSGSFSLVIDKNPVPEDAYESDDEYKTIHQIAKDVSASAKIVNDNAVGIQYVQYNTAAESISDVQAAAENLQANQQAPTAAANAARSAQQAKQYAESVRPDELVQKSKLIDLVYPVGSIYMSTNNVSPAAFLGGTWARIQGRFLLAEGNSYSAGSTGGEATHKITQNELPSHHHTGLYWSGDSTKGTPINLNIGTGNVYLAPSWTGGGSGSPIYTGSAGGGAAHNNMPPYLAVYMWKRTA